MKLKTGTKCAAAKLLQFIMAIEPQEIGPNL